MYHDEVCDEVCGDQSSQIESYSRKFSPDEMERGDITHDESFLTILDESMNTSFNISMEMGNNNNEDEDICSLQDLTQPDTLFHDLGNDNFELDLSFDEDDNLKPAAASTSMPAISGQDLTDHVTHVQQTTAVTVPRAYYNLNGVSTRVEWQSQPDTLTTQFFDQQQGSILSSITASKTLQRKKGPLTKEEKDA